jgi:hypothetical protein
MKIKYTLKNLYPGVYLCTIKDMYNLAMTFCRVQEFYESPFNQIRNKKFSLVDFMELYSKKHGCFTYAEDWGGFNVPGKVVAKLYEMGIDDYNKYDQIIEEIHNTINKESKEKNNYYLIAADNNSKTVEHELCHAFYTLNEGYRKDINKVLKKLKNSVYKKASKALFDLGYGESTLLDEFQAYFITDFASIRDNSKLTKGELCNLTEVSLELKKIFKDCKKSYNK